MSDLQVSAWKRYGHDRLYVNRPDGEKVAWLDRKTGHITFLEDGPHDAALEALAPYLNEEPHGNSQRARTAQHESPPRPPTSPSVSTMPQLLSPADDLALNRPGEALRAKVRELSPSLLERLIALLLGRRTEADSWRAGLVGERIVAAELRRLYARGWQVLHSIPLPREVDIDHLLIGPGGVFTINTKNHRGKSVWVGDDVVKVNYGAAHPYVRKSRGEAARVARALRKGCGFSVAVTPLLVFVGPTTLNVVPSLHDVRAIRERELAALAPLTGVLRPDQVSSLYAVARDRRTWLQA